MKFNVQRSTFKVGEFHTPHSAFRTRIGFTLIELLVVIAIIGILAGLIMYLLPGISEKKVRSRVQVELATVITQIESYKLKKGFYPPDNPGRPDRPPLYYELTAKQLPQPPD